MAVWHFQLFQVAYDGRRIGGVVMTDGSASLEQAIEEAKSVMRNRTFHFGKATLCVVKAKRGRLFERSVPIRKGTPPGHAGSLTGGYVDARGRHHAPA